MSNPTDPIIERRQALMGACACATLEEMAAAIELFGQAAEAVDVRPPEIGLVMVRGRVGGDGAQFNTGEATVTRAVVRLSTGELGYSYLLGRARDRARRAAIIDALGQDPARRATLEEAFLRPVMSRSARERLTARRKSAATRVNFFTLVRGEDGA